MNIFTHMSISTHTSESQVDTASNSSNELGELNGFVCCSDCEPLVKSEQTMKITSGIHVQENRYTVSDQERFHEDSIEQKKTTRRRNKKLRKQLRWFIRTSWKWIKRGFAGYSFTGTSVWMSGFSVPHSPAL